MAPSELTRSPIKALYHKYERYLPLLSFVGGFAFDALTLTRIDRWSDNLQLMAYLLLSGTALVVLGRKQHEHLKSGFLKTHIEWVQIVFNFSMGSLLSAYAIYYFRSAAFSKSYLFVGLLAIVWIASEFIPHRLVKLKIYSLLHFFSICAFFTFFLPIVTGRLGLGIFIAGAALSLVFTAFLWLVALGRKAVRRKELWRDHFGPPFLLSLILIILYLFNWIPPVPLSITDIGIYRSVIREKSGRYAVTYRQPEWYEIVKKDDRVFEYSKGDAVYCFAAVFAPTAMRQKIYHDWQHLQTDGTWKTMSHIPYPIIGGRDGGWRGFTMKRSLTPGKWRIDVVTENGQIISRIALAIVEVNHPLKQIVTVYK